MGTKCIRGELLKLGIVVSSRSIRRRTFLANQIKGIWAADLFVVQTVGLRSLYVVFFIAHARREVVHFRVTGVREGIRRQVERRRDHVIVFKRRHLQALLAEFRLLLQARAPAPQSQDGGAGARGRHIPWAK